MSAPENARRDDRIDDRRVITTARQDGLPVLPLRDVVVYPHMVIPLFVGREKSIRALDAAMEADKQIMLVAQKQRRRRRPGRRRTSTTSAPSQHPAAAEAARRHGQGAGRGLERARIEQFVRPTSTSPPRSSRSADGETTTSASRRC